MYSQSNYKKTYNFNLPISHYYSYEDSICSYVFQIPIFGFNFDFYSNPGLNNFLSFHDQYTLNLSEYYDNLNGAGTHHLDVNNNILYFGRYNENSFSSYGLKHRFFLSMSVQEELLSLIINGNYPYLNETIYLHHCY